MNHKEIEDLEEKLRKDLDNDHEKGESKKHKEKIRAAAKRNRIKNYKEWFQERVSLDRVNN